MLVVIFFCSGFIEKKCAMGMAFDLSSDYIAVSTSPQANKLVTARSSERREKESEGKRSRSLRNSSQRLQLIFAVHILTFFFITQYSQVSCWF